MFFINFTQENAIFSHFWQNWKFPKKVQKTVFPQKLKFYPFHDALNFRKKTHRKMPFFALFFAFFLKNLHPAPWHFWKVPKMAKNGSKPSMLATRVFGLFLLFFTTFQKCQGAGCNFFQKGSKKMVKKWCFSVSFFSKIQGTVKGSKFQFLRKNGFLNFFWNFSVLSKMSKNHDFLRQLDEKHQNLPKLALFGKTWNSLEQKKTEKREKTPFFRLFWGSGKNRLFSKDVFFAKKRKKRKKREKWPKMGHFSALNFQVLRFLIIRSYFLKNDTWKVYLI